MVRIRTFSIAATLGLALFTTASPATAYIVGALTSIRAEDAAADNATLEKAIRAAVDDVATHAVAFTLTIGRVILFDKRGVGLSDPVSMTAMPPIEEWMDDVRAVMDAVGSERAAVFGASEGGNMSILALTITTIIMATSMCTPSISTS